MSQMNHVTIRDYVPLVDTYTWSDWPIHRTGAALFVFNRATAAVEVVVEDSDDGFTWSTVLLSSPTASALTSIALVAGGAQVRLFASARRYVRVRLVDEAEDPVFVWLVGYPPHPRDAEDETGS